MSPLGIPSNREGLIQPSTTNQPPKFTPLTLENPSTAKLTTKHTSPITNQKQQNQKKIHIYLKSLKKKRGGEILVSPDEQHNREKAQKRVTRTSAHLLHCWPISIFAKTSTKGASFDEKEKNPSLQIEPRKSNEGNPHLLIPFFLTGLSQGELSTSLTKFIFFIAVAIILSSFEGHNGLNKDKKKHLFY